MPRQSMINPNKQQLNLWVTPDEAAYLRGVLERKRAGLTPLPGLDPVLAKLHEILMRLERLDARWGNTAVPLARRRARTTDDGRQLSWLPLTGEAAGVDGGGDR